jgi:hypothetical protein
MDRAYFEQNRLNIWVSHPMVDGRAESVLFLNDPLLNESHPYCTYPKSSFIDKEVRDCNDVFHFNIPWDLASKCGWRTKQEETHLVYYGQIILQVFENTNIGEWRFIQSNLRIKLRFKRFIAVEIASPAQVYNFPGLNAAITKQIVAVDLTDPALVELVTVLQWPYELVQGDMTLSPLGKIATYNFTEDRTACSGTQGQECRQRWKTSLRLNEEACTLDGTYRLNWTKACSSSATGTNCPLISSDEPTGVEYTLRSENFCAEISVEVGLTGSRTSFEDAAFAVARTAFIRGRRAYFLVKVASELTTVSLGNVQLVTVSVRPDGSSPVRLVENKVVASFDASSDPQAQAQIHNSTAGQVGFSFVFSDKLTALLQASSKQEFTIGAEVQVTYAQTKKRFNLEILADGNENVAFSSVTSLDNSVASTTSAVTPQETTSNAFVIVASFLLMFIALMI